MGNEPIKKKKNWFGIPREPKKHEHRSQPGKGAVLEEAGKCGKMWSKVKGFARNRVRWRSFTITLCS
jgi:hypothetical protein